MMIKKVCFIGACGHWNQALKILKKRRDVQLCGFAPGSSHEGLTASVDASLPWFGDYEAMLDTVKPDLAVVSPVFGLTGQVILACAGRGIDVFAEKPIAANLEELEQVKKAVAESGIRFCAMHYLRYAPAFWHGAQIVRSGQIGEVRLLTAQKSYKYGTRPAWYADPALYCGTIPWVGIHAMDWIAAFTQKRFETVTAKSLGKGPEMAAACQFVLEGGILASASLDFYRPAAAPTHGDDRIRCVGTEGVLEVCGGEILLINGEGTKKLCPDTAPELLTEFLDGGGLAPGEIFHLTHVALAAKLSAESGKAVKIGGTP